ncbi:MAG: hypothetical protein IPL53_16110 [Ignavibacteria bacterium]|nr:hypothetical protein [Ignavibacteria bacterium]
MKKIQHTFLLVLLFLSFNGISAQNTEIYREEFELVESVPVETDLEQSSLPRTLDVWLKMMNNAKESIDIETFYFADEKGQPLEEIITAIKNAASRGVQVRIIVDSSFYFNNKEKSIDALEGIQNISIKKIPIGNLAGGVMHAKYFIVDNENLFLGSQNMDWRALIHIHEIGVRVKNKELARTFSEVFETDWKLCDGNNYGLINQAVNYFVNSDNPVIINSNDFGKIILYPAFSPSNINMNGLSSEEEELLKIINNTKDSLSIQMYSYSPKAKNEKNYYDDIDKALRNAASRGVKIKIIFSDWSIKDPATEFIKNLSIVENIEIKFSTIPQYSGGYIPYSRVDHCKYFISDNNISWISTSNWEWGYFHNSRNATLIIENSKVNSELSKVFLRSWDGPYSNAVDINKNYEPVKRN